MPRIVVGPLLRYTGSTQATIWLETDAACEVRILGHVARTFAVEGHHFALVVLDDLEPATVTPYAVHLDGAQAWPPDDGRPPSTIHTRDHERQARLVFGSCRVGAPQRPPYALQVDEEEDGARRVDGGHGSGVYSRRASRGRRIRHVRTRARARQ